MLLAGDGKGALKILLRFRHIRLRRLKGDFAGNALYATIAILLGWWPWKPAMVRPYQIMNCAISASNELLTINNYNPRKFTGVGVMKRLSFAGCLLFFLAGAWLAEAGVAGAADLTVKAPIVPPVPVFSWTGVYLGIGGGAGWGER